MFSLQWNVINVPLWVKIQTKWRKKHWTSPCVLPTRWHRVAYSVEGQSVTLYLDCVKLDTLDLLRGYDPHVSTEGATVFGTRLLDEGVFEVGLSLCVIQCVCSVKQGGKRWSTWRCSCQIVANVKGKSKDHRTHKNFKNTRKAYNKFVVCFLVLLLYIVSKQ